MPSRPPLLVLFALAAVTSIVPMAAFAHDARGVMVALEEESIPAADLPSPGAPSGSPSPAAESTPNTGAWEQVPSSQETPAAPASPAAGELPAAEASPVQTNSPAAEAVETGAAGTPTEIPPAMDAGSIAAAPQISDSSLDPMVIAAAAAPARAAALRIAEKARLEIEQGRDDDAIRDLGYAVSIDSSNPYTYLYLGRAYRGKKDFAQAITFFQRAELGLASDPAWLGETYAFEGQCYEQSAKPIEAAAAYRKALMLAPGNLTARVGFTRLSAYAQAPAARPSQSPAPDAQSTPGNAIPPAPIPND